MRPGSRPRQPLSPPEPSHSVGQAIAGALPIVLVLILLPPLAFASPPDPSWVAGIYDGADADEIVRLVYETSAANHTAPPHLGRLPYLLDRSLEGIACHVADRHVTRGPRSPPVLRSLESTHVSNSLPLPPSGTDVSVSLLSITSFPCPRLTTSPPSTSQGLVQPTDDTCSASFMISNQGHPVKSLAVSLAFSRSSAFRSRSPSRFRLPSRSRSAYRRSGLSLSAFHRRRISLIEVAQRRPL